MESKRDKAPLLNLKNYEIGKVLGAGTAIIIKAPLAK